MKGGDGRLGGVRRGGGISTSALFAQKTDAFAPDDTWKWAGSTRL